MTAILAVAALLGGGPAPPAPAPAPPAASCQTFTRASAGAPDVVRAWLAHSSDDHVLVCIPPEPHADAAALYAGESAVGRRGNVCSYARHLLSRVADGATGKLQPYEHGDAVAMTLATGDCPPAHSAAGPDRYALTYDLSPGAFVAIMAYWATATVSAQSFDREIACCTASAGAPTTARRLRSAIAAGHHLGAAAVTRIVRLSGPLLRHRYALFVADPDSAPAGSGVYVIYLSKRIAGPYRITGVSDAAS